MRFGLACCDITPDGPVYLAGYAARTTPSEGAYLPLEARALVLDDEQGGRLVWVTADLIGFDFELGEAVLQATAAACGLDSEAVLLSCSHTHCGPTLRAHDQDLFGPDAVGGYDRELLERLPRLATEALDGLRPGALRYGAGDCRMGICRRRTVDGCTVMAPNPDGFMDPELPVLAVFDRDAGLAAAVVSYGCHPTTMGGQLIGPDYIGWLRAGLAESHPGVAVLFANGCGGDVKPNNVEGGRFRAGPLSEVERCGREVAAAARAVLDGPLRPVGGRLRSRRETIRLPLQPPYPREVYEQAVNGGNQWFGDWGRAVLARLDAGEPLPSELPFMVQVVSLGDSLCLVALGGEVCCGVGRRVKEALRARWPEVMVTAYANALNGYQASRAQFPDGGYEVDEWYRYSSLPAPYDPGIEDLITAAAERLAV
ncbi:MAG: neutral/alkaline non-lysosomal ceramidase N-terminal domain-containing protein [Armatimonadetes bacterium]|nr:neutral/alkaline non-lysosomal ceramidase N-terminal domain-containing protein [Armatimonadota bacterium]